MIKQSCRLCSLICLLNLCISCVRILEKCRNLTELNLGWTELGQEFIDACYQGDEAEVGNLLTIAGAKKRDFNTQDQYRKGVMMTLSTLQSD